MDEEINGNGSESSENEGVLSSGYEDTGESEGALGEARNGISDDSSKGGTETGIDWDGVSSDSYMESVTIPEVEGIEFNGDLIKEKYGQFFIENKIPPEVVSKFLEIEGGLAKENLEEARAREAEERKEFEAEGKELWKTFSKEQISTACEVLKKDFSGDKTFMNHAMKGLSNNKTLVKLLLNWHEHNRTDEGTGITNGIGSRSGQGFAARWTGNPEYK